MGTVNVLEAARRAPEVRAILIVTTDKCYQNVETLWGYREHDPLGGDDPYSSSKACAELVTASYRKSFFDARGGAVISARAGNVVGGGDFAADRIVPDAMRAFIAGDMLLVRNPRAVRPWQHVLDPLCAYLALIERAFADPAYARAWNLGPDWRAEREVAAVVEGCAKAWGAGARWMTDGRVHLKEATMLRLDTTRARDMLGYVPLLDFDAMVEWTTSWYRTWADGQDIARTTFDQIDAYLGQRVRLTLPGSDQLGSERPVSTEPAKVA
jgi:CDP-glucose 4,6-dehydratase